MLPTSKNTQPITYTSTPPDLLHFNKVESKSNHKKSHSVLLSNRLTKSYFSLHDTSLQNRSTLNKNELINAVRQMKHSKIKGANSKLLQRYHSYQDDTIGEYHNITQSYIPKITLKKKQVGTHVEIKRTKSTYLPRSNSNKFKLLFRDSSSRKTVAERKIDRLDRKILDLEQHNKYLTTLKPEQPKIVIQEKVKPRGTVVELERIKKLVRTLVRNISLYFSMYSHPKKVGDLLKTVEGYNQFFRHILFENGNQAKKITNQQEILKYFWVSKEPSLRPEYYGEEDLYLFNLFQNYSLKMERSYMDIKRNFIQFEKMKLEKLKKEIGRKLQINEKKLPFMSLKASPQIDKMAIETSIDIDANLEIDKIAQFVDNRKRHNQDRREASLAKLQSLGVRFNVEERSKELIVREKEKIMKNCSVKDRDRKTQAK